MSIATGPYLFLVPRKFSKFELLIVFEVRLACRDFRRAGRKLTGDYKLPLLGDSSA